MPGARERGRIGVGGGTSVTSRRREGASGASPEAVATEWARRQHGVVSRAQLLGAGLAGGAIDALVRRSRLRPVHRGVYLLGALAGPLEPPRAPEMAALLACGRDAVVSHRSAAGLWGLLPPPPGRAPVDVLIPGRDRSRHRGLRARRVVDLSREDVTIREGIPVTTAARTLVDLAGTLAMRELEQALARADRKGLAGRADVAAALSRRYRAKGAAALRELLASADAPAFTRSEAEERLLALVRSGGLPAPSANARIGAIEVDFLWRGTGVVVEVDGFAHHRSRRSFEGDRIRDARLAAMGLRVVRVTWRQLVKEPARTLVRLAQVLAVARGG